MSNAYPLLQTLLAEIKCLTAKLTNQSTININEETSKSFELTEISEHTQDTTYYKMLLKIIEHTIETYLLMISSNGDVNLLRAKFNSRRIESLEGEYLFYLNCQTTPYIFVRDQNTLDLAEKLNRLTDAMTAFFIHNKNFTILVNTKRNTDVLQELKKSKSYQIEEITKYNQSIAVKSLVPELETLYVIETEALDDSSSPPLATWIPDEIPEGNTSAPDILVEELPGYSDYIILDPLIKMEDICSILLKYPRVDAYQDVEDTKHLPNALKLAIKNEILQQHLTILENDNGESFAKFKENFLKIIDTFPSQNKTQTELDYCDKIKYMQELLEARSVIAKLELLIKNNTTGDILVTLKNDTNTFLLKYKQLYEEKCNFEFNDMYDCIVNLLSLIIENSVTSIIVYANSNNEIPSSIDSSSIDSSLIESSLIESSLIESSLIESPLIESPPIEKFVNNLLRFVYRIFEVLIKTLVGLVVGIAMVIGVICGQGLARSDHRQKFAHTFFTLNKTDEQQDFGLLAHDNLTS